MSYKKLGDYIQQVNNRNRDLQVDTLLGVSITKKLIPSIANTVGTDMSTYKIIEKGQFGYGTITSRNGDKISIALADEYDKALVSQIYIVFEVIDKNELLPEYLMMWFSRPEFDRYARYHSHGSTRESFDWEDLCEVELPIPSIKKQREIVAQYQAVANKIKVNEQICEKLEATAQTVYKQWFVDFEFPCLPSGYRPHGQVNQNLPIDEYITKIGSVCTYSRVGGLPVSDGKTWFVYLILCENDSVYKGMTNDLYRRFYEHYMGEGAEWTKLNKPLKVIHWESFATKEEAAKREKDLKTGYGRTWISRQIEKAGGITQLKTSLAAPQTELRTAGKMVFNEELEKEIPEGWEVKSLSDISKITMGQSPEGENYNEKGNGKIFYQGRTDFGFRIPEVRIFTTLSKKNAKKGDVLMSVRAPVGDLNIADSDCSIGRGIAALSSRESSYLFYLMKSFKSHFELSDGTGTIFSSINKDELFNLKLIYNEKYSKYFHENMKHIDYEIILISKQNQKLTQLQSLLLSRLATLEG
ncbi:restriction endonuclease subunit S [Empedobacter stercoris]|uniref:restriction endonuclease subunit S n=1 Tax=Empedobacter stercoris TaxID=1628248 RepID=UPI001CE18388|nr:restriction endonuclease subunit S [Empedobacter stercoris]MCA4776104.1 restriction endonuclease subunit S [Empedobacter stercoris]